uniref:Uncharacterized protein n=1 Tax=Arundo donax TaxID=35708 RepID=A0A0A8YFV5_ARUDO
MWGMGKGGRVNIRSPSLKVLNSNGMRSSSRTLPTSSGCLACTCT